MNINPEEEARPGSYGEGDSVESRDIENGNPQGPVQETGEQPGSLNLSIVLPENERHISFCSGIVRGLKMVQDAHAKAQEKGTQIGYEHEPPQSMPIIRMLKAKGLPIVELTEEDDPSKYIMVISPYGMPRREYQGEQFDTTCVQVKKNKRIDQKT